MAKMIKQKKYTRNRRKKHIRKKVKGTPEKPRLTVYRSINHIYAQLIDDVNGKTITGISSLAKPFREQMDKEGKKGKFDLSKLVGQEIAKKALDMNIERVVFDRNGFIYHGRVKAVADGAREGGLKF